MPQASATAPTRAPARAARRGGNHRLQRHRRRHPVHAAAGRRGGAAPGVVPRHLARRRRCSRSPARWPTPSWPRCGRARAASTSTCCRRTDASAGVPHRLDVVRRRLLGRDRRQRGGARVLRRPLRTVAGSGLDADLHACRCRRAARRFSPQTITALAAIWLMSWIHLRGVGPGRFVGNVLAAPEGSRRCCSSSCSASPSAPGR